MPEGTEIGKAYFTVNLDDRTEDDYRRIKAGLSDKAPVSLKTQLDAPSDAELKATRERMQAALSPINARVSVDTKPAETAVSNMSRTSGVALAAMFAGMPAAAAAAGVATAAALGGVTATFIGLGAVALKSNADVSNAWKTLGQDLKNQAASWAQPLAQPFIQSASTIRGTVQELSPQIRTAFANAAPGVAVLTGAVTDFARQAMPGVVIATSAAMPVMQGLRTMAGEVGAGFTQFFANVSTGARGAQQILGTLGGVVQDFEGFAGKLFANLASNGNPALQSFRTALQQAEQALLALTQNGSGAVAFFQGFGAGLTGTLTVIRGLAAAISALPAPMVQFAGSLTATVSIARLFGVNVGAAFDGLGGKIKSAISNANSFGSAMAGIGKAVAPALATGGALAVVSLGLDVMAQKQQKEAQAAQQSVTAQNAFYNALVASNGAIDENIQKLVLQQAASDKVGNSGETLLSFIAKIGGPNGVGLLQKAVEGDTGALDQLRGVMNDVLNADPSGIRDTSTTARDALSALNGLAGGFNNAAIAARASASASAQAAGGFVSSADAMSKQLAVANAAGSISDRLKQANQQAAQAALSVADAQHALAQSGQAVVNAQHAVEQAQIGVANANQGVVDAEHGVEQAQRSLAQAYQGVTTAQQAYTRAQQDELQAERDLNKAREQAIQDLKDLHLQLADQVVSEGQARVSLYDAQVKAAALGVDSSNAEAVSHLTVTAANEDRVKAALDLLSAQNQVNDTLNTGAKLRDQVTQADKAGVEGSAVVVAAQKQLQSAQDQVNSSAQALEQAQQQVRDAQWGVQQADIALTQAHQGVRDAAWSLRQAQLGVNDATWAQHQAAQQLTTAQYQLRQANDQTSTSFDINSAAGRQNLGALLNLWDAIQKQGGPVQDQYKALVDQTATSFGISRDRAQEYLDKLGLIPHDFQYGVTAVAQANFDELNRTYNDKFGGRIGPVAMNVAHANVDGGLFRGVGGPRDDANLSWISDGEYIVNAADTARHLPLLHAINSGKMGSDGAALPAYANGGLNQSEGLNYFLSGAGAAYQESINTLDVMGFPHPPGLPVYVPPPVAIGYNTSGAVAGTSAAAAQAYAASQLGRYGWGQDQMAPLIALWNQESGWNALIVNKSSGAYGIPQALPASKMAAAGPDWRTNPATQINWGLGYIHDRYGSPAGAEAHERAFNWYDNGGYMLGNPAINTTGKPEMVLPPGLSTTLEAINTAVQGGTIASGGGVTVHVHVNQLASDPYETAQVAARELSWALRH